MEKTAPLPRSRTPPLILLALLISAGLLAAVPASAQVIYISADNADRTFGWTFPEGTTADATLTDPTGDLDAIVGPAPATTIPGGAIMQALDLTGLEIHEIDEEVLLMRLTVANLDPAQSVKEHTFSTPRYTIAFSLGGVAHRIDGWLEAVCDEPATPLCEPYTNPALAFHAELEAATIDGTWSTIGTAPTRVLPENDALEVLVPRWALERAGSGAARPIAGDTITDLTVSARVGSTIIGGEAGTTIALADTLPDESVAREVHTLRLNSVGGLVTIRLDGADEAAPSPDAVNVGFGAPPLVPREARVDVDLERAPRIPIEVQNRFARGALVVPEVTLHDAPGDLQARVLESLTVPAGETRRFDVVITGNGTIDPEAPLVATVAVRTLGTGTPFIDRLTLVIREADMLTSDTNKLYLHTIGDQNIGIDLPTTMFHFHDGVLNTRVDDPNDNGLGSDMGIACICGDNVPEWSSEARILHTLHLDPAGNVTFHATIEAPVAGALELEASLFHDDAFVAGNGVVITLTEGTNTVDIALPVHADATELAPSERAFLLDTSAAFRPAADIPLTELSNVAHETNPRLVTQGNTWIALPIVENAERFARVDHLGVDLQKGFDAVQYVNPGRAALWNVTILNQGDAPDTVTVVAGTTLEPSDAAAWQTDTRPGRSFRLAPGESVTVGVLARASAAANEGDTARVNVTVASALADGATAGIRVTAVVTDGIEIDETVYVADNETSARVVLDKEDRGSPAPGAAWLILFVAALAMVRRRR